MYMGNCKWRYASSCCLSWSRVPTCFAPQNLVPKITPYHFRFRQAAQPKRLAMASWYSLPYELRDPILRLFCESIVEDYSNSKKRVETLCDHGILVSDNPPDDVASAPPGSLSSYKAAILVCHDWNARIKRVRLPSERANRKESTHALLKRRQVTIVRSIINSWRDYKDDGHQVLKQFRALRWIAGHFWKDIDWLKENLRIVCDVYCLLRDKDKVIWLAQLGHVFRALDENVRPTYSEIVPCFSADRTRHRPVPISGQFIWQHAFDRRRKIARLSKASTAAIINQKLPCCDDIWNREILPSTPDEPWFVFWDFTFVGPVTAGIRSLLGESGLARKRYSAPLFFINYERMRCFRVQSGKCTDLAGVWEYVV
jgi:hypothetical protein